MGTRIFFFADPRSALENFMTRELLGCVIPVFSFSGMGLQHVFYTVSKALLSFPFLHLSKGCHSVCYFFLPPLSNSGALLRPLEENSGSTSSKKGLFRVQCSTAQALYHHFFSMNVYECSRGPSSSTGDDEVCVGAAG